MKLTIILLFFIVFPLLAEQVRMGIEMRVIPFFGLGVPESVTAFKLSVTNGEPGEIYDVSWAAIGFTNWARMGSFKADRNGKSESPWLYMKEGNYFFRCKQRSSSEGNPNNTKQ